MRAVKLCRAKILQFLTGCAVNWRSRLTWIDLYNGGKAVVVVQEENVLAQKMPARQYFCSITISSVCDLMLLKHGHVQDCLKNETVV